MFEIPEQVKRLAKVTHFGALPLSVVHEIVSSGSVRTCPAGSIIYREGWECAGLSVNLKGRVHLYKTCYQGQESILSVIEPLIMFDEVAVLDATSNPVTAIAFQRCIT